ncbi:MAG: peptidoglycan-associated lipoprotein Pal [Moraxellaceae bacterium]|nr:peptidoglycan-associated lipoprotein Pal [Moraxellaceae bacterium]
MRSHLILSLIAAATLAACSSTPETKPAPAAAAPAPAAAPAAPAAKPAAAPAAKVDPYDPSQLNNPASLLSKRSIFFAYDKFDVSEDYQPLVVTHALFLTKNPSYKIVIQGNADERGSSEYNLALGQKRADAVKSGLVALGVSAGQIETISFGKEKPRNTGSDEVAWAENRRADIVYQGK